MSNPVIQAFGRKLRLAVVGGGPHSFIGPVHRGGALLHERFEVVASVLSSSAERSIKAGEDMGILRPYGDPYEMIKREAEREDGADVIAIMTPNDSHFTLSMAAIEAGLHIVCEKPLTNDHEEALKLQAAADKSDVLFCVAYGYSAYPMVRQAKAMIEDGVLGKIRITKSEYFQGFLAALTESEQNGTNWHMDKSIAGPSLIVGDIGTHCYHLLSFVSGLTPKTLSADVCATVPGRECDDYCNVLMRYEDGARGSMQITQAAAGAVHGLNFSVYGEFGGLEWYQEQPNELVYRPIDAPMQVLTRGGVGLHDAANAVTHVAVGHPEGYIEAFANLYFELSNELVARKLGEPVPDYSWYPRLEEGIEGVRFVDAAVNSRDTGGQWVEV
ncbi:Gfo/Idh/MocA family oxidoreductase [Leucothrix sargassi]|nr:Gfo/Idh/MocA family oxidoreductase [Leucothrix sargassi]